MRRSRRSPMWLCFLMEQMLSLKRTVWFELLPECRRGPCNSMG